MQNKLFLYMVMLGCKPRGRVTEQHDIFFGIGASLKDLVHDMKKFWPEAQGKIHIDAWRKITQTDGFSIEIIPRPATMIQQERLFFVNLGGYKENVFEEYHYKVLTVGKNKAEAVKKAKQSTFYKHYDFKGAASHIDDTYGVDVDDIYVIEDILPIKFKEQFQLKISPSKEKTEDTLHIGYLKIDTITS